MSTFLFGLAESFSARLVEIRAIIGRAEAAFETDQELYDILCRAGAVLMVSGLEAFIKDINEAIQSDINANIDSFEQMPAGMKREFTLKIAQIDGASESDINKKSRQLAKFFATNSVKIDLGAFPNKENTNKNPSSSMVDTAFQKYGIRSILYCLHGSNFEAVFDGDSASNVLVSRQIKRMRATLFHFPYRELPADYTLTDWDGKKGEVPPSSLWQDFLGNILRRRHGIVHADTRDNPTSWESLRADTDKLEILFAGLTYAASSLLARDLQPAIPV
ncbi:hypothetical protein KZ810_15010 [Sphingomonas sp. RHCKR47]|uniref:HEPN domain-containing protein n=1 Tax=Sphingomonas citricola TaxID=2862498 RepID=UPI001CA5EE8F|nr:HEPN domain-containing protein [Sphingomonas citricola]MBW6524808.1 hypothetical protein [Sphingomonas citricola]